MLLIIDPEVDHISEMGVDTKKEDLTQDPDRDRRVDFINLVNQRDNSTKRQPRQNQIRGKNR